MSARTVGARRFAAEARKYFAIARTLFKAQIVYRFSIVLQILMSGGQILFGLLVWSAAFETGGVEGFTLDSMLTYYVAAAFLSRLVMDDSVTGEIQARIRDGSLSKFMVVPTNIRFHFAAQTAGAQAFLLLFNVAGVAGWTLLFGIRLAFTADIRLWLAAAALALLGTVFIAQLNFFLGILTFKFENIGTFLLIKSNLLMFASGGLVPLALLPDAALAVMRLLPFYYATYLPSMLLIGSNAGEALPGLAVLVCWVAVFAVVNPLTYRHLRVKYDGAGG